jgi:ribonuclease D
LTVAYSYLTTNAELKKVCEQWERAKVLALDTEFMRVSTFYPQAALFQINDGIKTFLIDPLSINDWSSFAEVLINPEIIKLFHSCSEDILAFIHHLGVQPKPIFDTQIAASLLGSGLSVSYQHLVKQYCGIDLPKAETRSDWLQRPLTEDQLIYAALDVEYLQNIYQQQKEELLARGRLAWNEEESNRLNNMYKDEFTKDFSRQYLSLKGGWSFQAHNLKAFQLLVEWREQRARKRDKPRGWIIKDNGLLQIAQNLPSSKKQLADLSEVSENFVLYEGEHVLQLVDQACQREDVELLEPVPAPLTNEQRKKVKKIRVIIEQRASELGLAADFLLRGKLIRYLLGAAQAGEIDSALEPDGWLYEKLGHWRLQILFPELKKAIEDLDASI